MPQKVGLSTLLFFHTKPLPQIMLYTAGAIQEIWPMLSKQRTHKSRSQILEPTECENTVELHSDYNKVFNAGL